MNDNILEIRSLCKSFRSHWTFRPVRAVENVSLTVKRGEAFGFLGHNGAGKTTAIKCIVGLIRKSSGEILLNGQPLVSAKQRSCIGYLPEQPYFYDHLTVGETLEFFTALHDIPKQLRNGRVEEILELVGLTDRRRSPVRALSKGLQQRLGIAQAIVNKPQLLLLDEPFSGLDPVGRIDLRKIILDLRAAGATIFMSSHILHDVESICDRVAIMAGGIVRAEFELQDTSALYGEHFELVLKNFEPDSAAGRRLTDMATGFRQETVAHKDLTVLEFADRQTAERALTGAAGESMQIISFTSTSKSLEEIFIQVTRDAQSASARAKTSPKTSEAGGLVP